LKFDFFSSKTDLNPYKLYIFWIYITSLINFDFCEIFWNRPPFFNLAAILKKHQNLIFGPTSYLNPYKLYIFWTCMLSPTNYEFFKYFESIRHILLWTPYWKNIEIWFLAACGQISFLAKKCFLKVTPNLIYSWKANNIPHHIRDFLGASTYFQHIFTPLVMSIKNKLIFCI